MFILIAVARRTACGISFLSPVTILSPLLYEAFWDSISSYSMEWNAVAKLTERKATQDHFFAQTLKI